MGKKVSKRQVDEELMDALFYLEKDWKEMESIASKSIDTRQSAELHAVIAQEKYLLLLKEARRRKLQATRF